MIFLEKKLKKIGAITYNLLWVTTILRFIKKMRENTFFFRLPFDANLFSKYSFCDCGLGVLFCSQWCGTWSDGIMRHYPFNFDFYV